jgi:hypothetical protein
MLARWPGADDENVIVHYAQDNSIKLQLSDINTADFKHISPLNHLTQVKHCKAKCK